MITLPIWAFILYTVIVAAIGAILIIAAVAILEYQLAVRNARPVVHGRRRSGR